MVRPWPDCFLRPCMIAAGQGHKYGHYRAAVGDNKQNTDPLAETSDVIIIFTKMTRNIA